VSPPRQAAAKKRQLVLLTAVEDPTIDGMDIGGIYRFRTPHKILSVRDHSGTWPDVNEWDDFITLIEELFPHQEEWLHADDLLEAAEKTL